MRFFTALVAFIVADLAAAAAVKKDVTLLTDINLIKRYWGQVTPYNDTPASYFGVQNVGLPYGCGYEQVHVLHRHGARYPTGATEDGVNDGLFASKVAAIQAKEGSEAFSGPLSFLNLWKYYLGTNLLLPTGAAQDYTSGTMFWNTRGRLLYNATIGQAYYNATFPNGTARPLPLLRTTSQERILDSALAWANGEISVELAETGFFGPENATSKYNLLIIPEGGTENNTLASYDSCLNDDVDAIGSTGDDAVFEFIATGFLDDATDRLNGYLIDGGLSFNANDTYAMMEICSYEYAAFGSSDFCGLFTQSEWEGFEYTLDLEYYYDYAFGSAIGRAQGIGYLQELVARINQQYIPASNTSVNSTLDNNPNTFPLGQRFYLDMSHDDILISVITAESVDYFKESLPKRGPIPLNRHFRLTYLTPFGTRLYSEIIGCASASPTEVQNTYTQPYPGSNGYNASNAPYKFFRQTWNNAIVPLATIEGGACGGRTDGMCPLSTFLASQKTAEAKANYQFGCFANYTDTDGNGDGSVFA